MLARSIASDAARLGSARFCLAQPSDAASVANAISWRNMARVTLSGLVKGTLESAPNDCAREMTRVPRHQVIYGPDGRQGDVLGVSRGVRGNDADGHKLARAVACLWCEPKKGHFAQQGEAALRG